MLVYHNFFHSFSSFLGPVGFSCVLAPPCIYYRETRVGLCFEVFLSPCQRGRSMNSENSKNSRYGSRWNKLINHPSTSHRVHIIYAYPAQTHFVQSNIVLARILCSLTSRIFTYDRPPGPTIQINCVCIDHRFTSTVMFFFRSRGSRY